MHTIGIRTDGKYEEIPASFRDLAECPAVAALTTVTADGYPHTSVVWCDFDGECIRVNTMRGFVKDRNMRRNPRVTPAELTTEGALGHLDAITQEYTGYPAFYGYVYHAGQRAGRRESSAASTPGESVSTRSTSPTIDLRAVQPTDGGGLSRLGRNATGGEGLWLLGPQWWATGGPLCPVHSLTIMVATAKNPAPAMTPTMTSLVSTASAIPRPTAMPVSTVISSRWPERSVRVIVVLPARARAQYCGVLGAWARAGPGPAPGVAVLRQASFRLSAGPLCKMALV